MPGNQRPAKLYGMLDGWMARSPWLRDAQSRAAALLHGAGVRANHATAAAAAAGMLSGLAFACRLNAAGLTALWLSAALDALDGTIARNFERPIAIGGCSIFAPIVWSKRRWLVGIVWPRPFLAFAALIVVAS